MQRSRHQTLALKIIIVLWLGVIVWSLSAVADVIITDTSGRIYTGTIIAAVPRCPTAAQTVYCGQFWYRYTLKTSTERLTYDDAPGLIIGQKSTAHVNPLTGQILGLQNFSSDSVYGVAFLTLSFIFLLLGSWLKLRHDNDPWRHSVLRVLGSLDGSNKLKR